MLTFQVESLADVREEAEPLLIRHWQEIALNQDTVPLDPDWAAYEKLEHAGRLCITTVRENGRLIGYVSDLIGGNLHYLSLRLAENDIFWLAPEHRRGRTGARLILESERNATALGVNKLVKRVKLHNDVGPFLERLGYVAIERVYVKGV